MSIDWVWLLMGACAVFALGWVASRFDIQQLKLENQRNPKAYFQGLNFLLNEQQDQAIDSFIEAVQQDPDTSELHFALGNLFRKRGEFERAVRVHQHLLARADLSTKDRHRAMFDLAQDYLRAGIIDRAENALKDLEGTQMEGQAMLSLLTLYERSRDWEQAAKVAERLQTLGEGDFSARLAHYLCEQAKAIEGTDPNRAQTLIESALVCSPLHARSRLALAQLLRLQGKTLKALNTIKLLFKETPRFSGLGAPLLAQFAKEVHQTGEALNILNESYQNKPRLDVLEALIELSLADEELTPRADDSSPMSPSKPLLMSPVVQNLYAQHLVRTPSLIAATHWLSAQTLSSAATQATVLQTLDKAATPLKRYRCAACGFEALTHFWQCPGCQSWDSYPPERVEEL
jgi:lipopolysaccharide biosynthesis regulator YciM